MSTSRRLELARGLLKLPADANVSAWIKTMSVEARDRLRAQVDWVQDYERTELKMAYGSLRNDSIHG